MFGFLGEIKLFPLNATDKDKAPDGWALCDGRLLQISQNQALFSVISVKFGGNAVIDFALPDLIETQPVPCTRYFICLYGLYPCWSDAEEQDYAIGDFYLGEIRLFPYTKPLEGFALCDGRSLRISENESLFRLFGTRYGGDGKSCFQIPNLLGTEPDPRMSYYMAIEGLNPLDN